MTTDRRSRRLSTLSLAALLGTALLAGWPAAAKTSPEVNSRPRLTLAADALDGMCALGETITFTAEVRNTSREAMRCELRWSMETAAFEPPAIEPEMIEVAERETDSFQYELKMAVPGFVRMTCTVVEEGSGRDASRSRRVGCSPRQVLSELTAEPDLGEFWAESIAALAKVEPEYELTPIEREDVADSLLYGLVMRSHGGVRVRGWLEVPRAEGPHPALLRVPGYTQNMQPVGNTNGAVVLSFNIRGHGNSTDDVPGRPVDFWIRGLDAKETNFYRGAYLDCLRAVDYLASREDVDMDRLVVWGASQGGGLAFATAALDPRVDLCVADIPWLCDWKNYLELAGKTDDEEIKTWLAASQTRTPESTLKTLSYFDTMNLADRVHCPTLMGIGLQDSICPPATSFATFNRISGTTGYRIYENSGHGLGAEHYEWILRELEERLRREDS